MVKKTEQRIIAVEVWDIHCIAKQSHVVKGRRKHREKRCNKHRAS